jgi:hypothetical protein
MHVLRHREWTKRKLKTMRNGKNPKSEGRNPKEIGSPKAEIRIPIVEILDKDSIADKPSHKLNSANVQALQVWQSKRHSRAAAGPCYPNTAAVRHL